QIITSDEIKLKIQDSKSDQIVLPLTSKNFNEVLGGGFISGKSYLIFGPNKTGKTQLCHQLCVNAFDHLYRTQNVKNKKIIFYLDTENTFRPERLEEISTASNVEVISLLKSIQVSKIMSNTALLLALKNLEEKINENYANILIIDTINNYFRADLSNSQISFIKARETFLNILKLINDLTSTHNLITVVTAQVTSNFSRKAIIQEIPVGNQFLNHFFAEYLYLHEKKKNEYTVQLVNSLTLSEKIKGYKISKEGIQDVIT
ncbi:MAG: AAA family ATPase, partial [Promethearchaeota archaeon]